MKGIGGHHRGCRGRTDEWLTPPEIIEALGPFDLDPCSPVVRPWPTAQTHYTARDDGLCHPWSGRVWLNPPYGARTTLWLRKLAYHGDGIALVFARTETDMFHRWVWPYARAMLFLRGRLHFHRPDGSRADANAGGPSVLLAYGERNADVLRGAKLSGKFVPLCPPS